MCKLNHERCKKKKTEIASVFPCLVRCFVVLNIHFWKLSLKQYYLLKALSGHYVNRFPLSTSNEVSVTKVVAICIYKAHTYVLGTVQQSTLKTSPTSFS